MKVVRPGNERMVRFGDVPSGGVFTYDSTAFMKVKGHDDGICLETGLLRRIGKDHDVLYHPKAEVALEPA